MDPLRNIKAKTKPNVTPILRVSTKFRVTGEPEKEFQFLTKFMILRKLFYYTEFRNNFELPVLPGEL